MSETPEMVERVARAIYKKFEDRPAYAQLQMNSILAEELARAAIEAMHLTEAQLLRDIADEPAFSTARKPHYWLKKDTREVYAVVWLAWLRGLVTCPLWPMSLTPAGRAMTNAAAKPATSTA